MFEAVTRMEGKKENTTVQRASPSVKRKNSAKILTQLKECVTQRAGLAVNNVRGHYNSDLPTGQDASTYTKENQMKSSSGKKSHLPHALGNVVQQKLGNVRANAMHSSGVMRSSDIGHCYQANESSAGKRVAIFQRMRNNIIQRCGVSWGTGTQAGVGNTGISLENFKAKNVPKISEGFEAFFNSLTVNELSALWKIESVREKIENRLRSPGGYHEWLCVSQAPKIKSWGITAEQIRSLRTPTKQVKFVNPDGRHGGRGSTSSHNEIINIIKNCNDFQTYKTKLNEWAKERLQGGVEGLPIDLQVN